MAIHTKVVPKSMKFTPTDDKGGTLTWTERVERPGFRPKLVQRSIRKNYHVSPLTEPEATVYGDSQEMPPIAEPREKISDPETRWLADQAGGATP